MLSWGHDNSQRVRAMCRGVPSVDDTVGFTQPHPQDYFSVRIGGSVQGLEANLFDNLELPS
eukprot:868614-Amorphochlora_amoeboformis.AAC.1